MIYRHYGSDHFDKTLFNPITNVMGNKPHGGLWACDKEQNPWYTFCKMNDFKLQSLDTYFDFKLKPDAKILVIDHDKVSKFLPTVYNDLLDEYFLDFEYLAKNYDVIIYNMGYSLHPDFYGWDVNSILVMNPNVIEEVDNEYNWNK